MKWMMGAVLALGLGGCSWQDDVKVRVVTSASTIRYLA